MQGLDYTMAFITLTFMFIKALLVVMLIIGVIMIMGMLAIDALERMETHDTKPAKKD